MVAFRITEGKKSLQNYCKYSCLSSILSHAPPYKRETVKDFEAGFNLSSINFNRYDPMNGIIVFDLESNKTRRSLDKVAKEIIKDARSLTKL
jgi:hypothetical protein